MFMLAMNARSESTTVHLACILKRVICRYSIWLPRSAIDGLEPSTRTSTPPFAFSFSRSRIFRSSTLASEIWIDRVAESNGTWSGDSPDPGKPGPYNNEEHQHYNTDYLFGITRAVVRSTIVPAGKVPLFILTVPLDIAFLPFAAIGGFFG